MPTRERASLAQQPGPVRPCNKPETSSPALATYDRRQWELYRLSVVEEWQESPRKAAVIGAINHKLMILALQEKASIDLPDVSASTPQPPKFTP
jgi:hypothetical protein